MGTVPGRRPDTGGEERREGQRATPARSEPGLSGLPRPLPRWPLLCWFAAKRGLRGQETQTSGVRCPLCPGRGRASHPGSTGHRRAWTGAHRKPGQPVATHCPVVRLVAGPLRCWVLSDACSALPFTPSLTGAALPGARPARPCRRPGTRAPSRAPPCGQQPLGRLRAWDGVGPGADFLPLWEAAPGPTRQTPEPLATKPGSATHGRHARQHPAGTVLLGGGGSLRHPCLGTRTPAARNVCCGDRRLLRAGSRARGPAVPLSCVSPPPSHSQGGGEACSAAQQRDGRLRPATGFPASSAPTLSPGLGPPNAAGPRASAVPPVVG